MSKATAFFGACKDTTCIQVTYTAYLFTPAIIGIYEATKNHLIAHVPANTIAVCSGASIGQVATNPLEMSKSDWDTHISETSNNNLLRNMPCWSMLSFENKKSIWDERDCRGIKRPHPSGGHGPDHGFRGGHGGRVGRNGAVRGSSKDIEIDELKKHLANKSLRSIINVNARKGDNIDVSTKFAQANKKNK